MKSVEHKGTFTIIITIRSIGGYLLRLSSNRRKITNQIIESRNTEAKQDKNKNFFTFNNGYKYRLTTLYKNK